MSEGASPETGSTSALDVGDTPTGHADPSVKNPPNTLTKAPPPGGESRPARRLLRTYVIVAVVILVAIVLVAYVATGGLHNSHSSNVDVLLPVHTVDSIPAYQFDAIDVTASTTSSINGTFFVTFELAIYVMTPAQLETLAKTSVVSGYEWTSGSVQNDSIYTLGVSISPGAWDLVFFNPSPINSTAIGFYTDLTLTPS